MFENNYFRISLTALMLLVVSLACNLNGITVACSESALITALNNANANPGHTTLNLDPGCVYTLTAIDNTATSIFNGTTFDYGDNGLPQITTPITINGNNATITRDTSAPKFRFFFITDSGSLIINDLTLSNGSIDRPGSGFPSSGGAIYNDGCTLETNRVTLQSNEASAQGGAIFNCRNGTIYINDSTISQNSSPNGGGIFLYSGELLSIDGSSIIENNAINSGGGINVENGSELIVNNSTITSNHAGRHGGGIYKSSGYLRLPTTITGTTFQENTTDWGGGGVFIFNSPLTISDSLFQNNQANELGGGLGYQNRLTETVLISNTTFEENIALWNGGGIHFSGKLMTINGSTFLNNQAEDGAGIHNGPPGAPHYLEHSGSEIILTSSIVQGNIASQNGGGVFNEETMTCGESTFIGNESFSLGGGIHNTGTVEVVGCTFDKNQTGFDGGGINSYNIAEIRGSVFSNNTATRGGGFATIGGEVDIRDSTFTGNSASDRGGAVFNMGPVPGASPLTILNSEINQNTASFGGGVATSLGDTKVSDSNISENTASSAGGGIYNDGLMKVVGSILSENESGSLGGGIHNEEEITVQDSTFKENIALSDGGGFCNYDTATITGSAFIDNNAYRGGGLASAGRDTTLTNNTFSGNTATDSGGGLFNTGPLTEETTPGGTMQANHITVAYNSAPSGGGIATGSGLMQIKNSIVAHSSSGVDCDISSAYFSGVGENINTDGSCTGFTLKDDPLLDTLANNGGPTETHALKTGSPAIDAAPDCTTISGATVSVDQRGQSRPGGPVCDLGAYEDEVGNPVPLPCIQTNPEVTAIKNANCRYGPSTAYDIADTLFEGESALIQARNEENTWWQINGPSFGKNCWVSYVTVDVCGDAEAVPVGTWPRLPDEPSDESQPSPQGCLVYDDNQNLICVFPCPASSSSQGACTPDN